MSASLVQAFLMQLGHPQSRVLPTRSTSFQEKRQGPFLGGKDWMIFVDPCGD